jgi:hypothetical protein
MGEFNTRTNLARELVTVHWPCVRCGDLEPVEALPDAKGNLPEWIKSGLHCEACCVKYFPKSSSAAPVSSSGEPGSIPEKYFVAKRGELPPCYRVEIGKRPSLLAFIGPSGTQKSRAASVYARETGMALLWFNGNELRDLIISAATAEGEQRAESSRRLERVKAVPLLVLDDLSQAKFTEASASAFWAILEARYSQNLPIVWTSQMTPAELRQKIAHQCGDSQQAIAITRRLCEDGDKLTWRP